MYQLKEGQIASILHRVSGVAVILFLFVHLVENFFLLMGREAYNAAIGIYDHWYFRLGEFALIAAVVYHALNGLRIIVMQQWQQSLGQARQIPLRDMRLPAVSVAAMTVDGAEHRGRIIRVHERAGPVVDRLA